MGAALLRGDGTQGRARFRPVPEVRRHELEAVRATHLHRMRIPATKGGGVSEPSEYETGLRVERRGLGLRVPEVSKHLRTVSVPLSPRQQEVALLVVRGLSNKAIAKALHTFDRTGKKKELSVKTVEAYLERICERLGGEGKPRVRIIRWYYSDIGRAA